MLEPNKLLVDPVIFSKNNYSWEWKMIHREMQSHEFMLIVIKSLWI
jgi:hypothetical protein